MSRRQSSRRISIRRYHALFALTTLIVFGVLSIITNSYKLLEGLAWPVDLIEVEESKATRVIIVGAGVAGLTAAKRLLSANINNDLQVQILEASSQFGGRVQKDTSGFASDDFPMDIGASWVYDPSRLPLMAQNRSSAFRKSLKRKHRAPFSWTQDFSSYKIRSDGRHKVRHMEEEDTDHLWVHYSWYDFLTEQIVQPMLKLHYHHHRPLLEYNCPVDRIHQHNKDQVLVGCGNREFWAHHVIVTVPLSMLLQARIDFSPPLPRKLLQTSSKMWQGFKIFLEFTDKFYYDVFEWSPHDGEKDFWDFSKLQCENNSRHILTGYYIGKPYEEVFQDMTSEEQMVQQVLKDLDQVFGDKQSSRSFVKHLIVHWSANPNIQGIYSNKAVRLSKQGGPQPLWDGNRLLVAGEAFPIPPEHNGWVDGASLSGLHAAELLLNSLELLSGDDFSIPDDLWEDDD